MEIRCDADTHPWSVEVVPSVGTKFTGGKGASLTFSIACGVLDCSLDYQERVVQLSRHG